MHPQLTRRFLEDRLRSGDSVLLIARIAPRKAAGFAQLYRLFDGPACRPMFLLYDFFVDPAARGEGIATALLHAAAEHARAQNAIRLDLMTELSNHAARKLYARAGWTQAEDFAVYCQDPNVARAAQG